MAEPRFERFLAARFAEEWAAGRDAELASGTLTRRATRAADAKRAVLARHSGVHWCAEPQNTEWVIYQGGVRVVEVYPCGDLRDLLGIYADHPESDPAWARPGGVLPGDCQPVRGG
jgi:hypothetical protein